MEAGSARPRTSMENGPGPASADTYAIAIGRPSEGDGPPLVTPPTRAASARARPGAPRAPARGPPPRLDHQPDQHLRGPGGGPGGERRPAHEVTWLVESDHAPPPRPLGGSGPGAVAAAQRPP